jgi:16S rRNA C1402 (ribose-2'-O) methylase RsmI
MAALIADAGNELVVWSKKNGIAQPVVSGAMSQNWGLLHSRKF